jgi:hypothetical protein
MAVREAAAVEDSGAGSRAAIGVPKAGAAGGDAGSTVASSGRLAADVQAGLTRGATAVEVGNAEGGAERSLRVGRTDESSGALPTGTDGCVRAAATPIHVAVGYARAVCAIV